LETRTGFFTDFRGVFLFFFLFFHFPRFGFHDTISLYHFLCSLQEYGVSQRLFSGYPTPTLFVLSARSFTSLCLYAPIYIYVDSNFNLISSHSDKQYILVCLETKAMTKRRMITRWSDDECGFARITYPAIKLRLSHHLLI
jgi:hypothetical protein